MDFLARSDQSVRRLSDKLRRKNYSAEEIEETVQWLQEKKYLNDEEGCTRRFQYMYEESCYSLRQIIAKLRQQGYAGDLIDSLVPDDTYEREYAAARECLRRKFRRAPEKEKMYRHLCMKGFSYDVAREAAEDFGAEAETVE